MVALLCAGLAGLGAGCQSLRSTYFNVGVDAITAQPDTAGLSYRLLTKEANAYQDPAAHKLIEACVIAALASRGLYQAPDNTRPDLLIEIDYGVGTSIRLSGHGNATHEIYLSLSARMNPGDTLARGPEVWNVRTSINEETSKLIVIMPVLASVAADYAGIETINKQTLRVSDQSPGVVLVRSNLGLR